MEEGPVHDCGEDSDDIVFRGGILVACGYNNPGRVVDGWLVVRAAG